MLPIQTRQPTAHDESLLLSTFLKSLRNQKPYRFMDTNIYYSFAHCFAKSMLSTARILIAHEPTDETEVYGWAAFNGNALIWIYVKQVFRNARVGTQLMEICFADFKIRPVKCAIWTSAIAHLQESWMLEFDTYELIKLVKLEQ